MIEKSLWYYVGYGALFVASLAIAFVAALFHLARFLSH
jgi:hypothetical protein